MKKILALLLTLALALGLCACGGSATENLRTAVLKATDMQLHHICRLVPGGVENSATARSAIAAGAAMQ